MLKKICMVTLLVTSLLLAGCNFDSEEYKTPTQQAEELQSDIMECFINKDVETLKSYFCKYTRDNVSDLDDKIKDAFNLIDGEIVSYDEPFATATGSMDRKDYGAETENIITDKGTEYSISFIGWLTNDEEPDKIGILVLVIKNQTLLAQNVDPEKCEVRIKVVSEN